MKSTWTRLLNTAVIAVSVVLFTLSVATSKARADSPYCHAPNYSANLCAQYGGSNNGAYCQPNTASYNPTLCAPYGASTSRLYCQQGTASYNPSLCAQYGGSNNNGAYCQPGTANYNPALCAPYGASTSSLYCRQGTASYNPSLCAPYGAGASIPPAGGLPAQVSLASSASNLGCNGTASFSVAVRAANGSPITDGTSVSLSSTLGTVSPTQGTTRGGSLSGIFTGGVSTGTATISAVAGGISNNTGIAVTCATTAPLTSSTVVPQPAAPPPAGNIVLRPPNTGDAGLRTTSRIVELPLPR